MDARSTPKINSDFNSHKNSETSNSSEDFLTSSEQLFNDHDTIDLSTEIPQKNKDYVRISKQEYEEIKSRVSAIENRLSREFTDVIPRVQPLQQVQNVYEQTLEEVAMLNCPNSDHLARRLSKELKIRPNEEAKIIRSPSARKIGSIRRRSRENLTKIVRHKSWNITSQSQANHVINRFYPYVGLNRQQTISSKADMKRPKITVNEWEDSQSENSFQNVSDISQKYQLRKRISLAADYSSEKPISRIPARRSLNLTINNSRDNSILDTSMNNTISSKKSSSSEQILYENGNKNSNSKLSKKSIQHKWRSAAAFFMDKTGEVDNSNGTGRPSVNKLRKQNAGAVMAKAKLFESSSDKSSEINDKVTNTGFARRPRISGQQYRTQKVVAQNKHRAIDSDNTTGSTVRAHRSSIEVPAAPKPVYSHVDRRANRKTTPPVKKVVSPHSTTNVSRTPQIPVLKKTLVNPKISRTPAPVEVRKTVTPMKAVHISPRRRSPRQKLHRAHH